MIYLRVGKWPGSDSGPFLIDYYFVFLHFFVFLVFRPLLRPRGWCQNIPQTSPTLFGKTSFSTPGTFLEHVRNMSKKCILSYHIIWYHMMWYDIIRYHRIWYHMICYDITWYHMVWIHVIWYYMILHDMIWQVKMHFLDMFRTCSKKVWRVKN